LIGNWDEGGKCGNVAAGSRRLGPLTPSDADFLVDLFPLAEFAKVGNFFFFFFFFFFSSFSFPFL